MTLIDQLAGPQGDLLDLHRVLAGQWPAQGSHPNLRALRQSWREPGRLHDSLTHLHTTGYRASIVSGEALFFEMVKPGGAPIPALVPIVPNIQGLIRDSVEYGMAGAGLRRVMRAGAVALAGMGLRNLTSIGTLLKLEDFPLLLRNLVELEIAGFAKYTCPAFLLQPQMTDLSIAANNPRLVETFLQAVRKRTSAQPGLFTNNPVAAVAALKTWGLDPALLLTPFGAEPGSARPDNDAAAHALKASGLSIWADRRLAPFPPSALDRSAFKRAGILGASRDDLGLWLGA